MRSAGELFGDVMYGTTVDRIRNISLKNKIFFSITIVILLISVLIAVFTRWILISSLTGELKNRGSGIAHSIAESSRSYILTENRPALTSLVFDARLGERRQLVAYVYILDKQNHVLAHSFTVPFPDGFHLTNPIQANQSESTKMLQLNGQSIYDVAVYVNEGIYTIGTVHIGLNKNHIDKLIGKLRTTFLGFLSVVTILCFGISHLLSRYITRPISTLTRVADDISRGNFDIQPDLAQTISGASIEVRQLGESLINMTNHIKDSQIRLTESEGKYRSLVNSGPNPIFVIDCNSFEILDANPSAEEIYGYSKDDLIGRPFTDLGPFEMDARSVNEWHMGKRLIHAKVQFYKKNQVPFYVNVHACPTRYLNRDALIVATTDISEMVEKDSQLIQASKMTTLGEMSAGIAHELNQPLNAIKMASEFLGMMMENKRLIPEKNLHEVTAEISTQVDRSTEIINRLRDFGRKADFTKEMIVLNKPVRNVLKILGKQLSLQNIHIELDLDDTLPPVLAHHNRLEQVIFNLVTNARDAINQKQELSRSDNHHFIRIRTLREGDKAVVSVSDNGIGIPATVKDRIFEAFFTTKEMGEGMGLGLSISSGIVEDYGGKIDMESKEGVGTTFRLTFPGAF